MLPSLAHLHQAPFSIIKPQACPACVFEGWQPVSPSQACSNPGRASQKAPLISCSPERHSEPAAAAAVAAVAAGGGSS